MQAISRGEPVKRGPRGAVLTRIVRFASFLGLSLAVVALVGALEVMKAVVQQNRGRRRAGELARREGDQCERLALDVFVGFGARAEETLFEDYRSQARVPVVRVDQCNLPTTGHIGAPGLGQILRCFRGAIGNVRIAIGALPMEYREQRIDFIASSGMRLGTYAYAKAWWRDVRTHHDVREACFLAADTNAFAATSEGVHALFIQHGLLSKSLLLPEFDEVRTLTHFECENVQRRLPHATVRVSREMRSPDPARRTPCLVVVSTARTIAQLTTAVPLLRYLSVRGVMIHVSPYQGEPAGRFWGSLPRESGIPVEWTDRPFDRLLEELQPSLVVGWGSTTLVDALYRGIIPVCMASPDDRQVNDTLYPLLRCCLRWPEHQDVIGEALTSPATYAVTLERLRQEDTAGA